MPKPLDQIMQRQMTRQEFMITLGLGIASITGFSTIIHLLTGKSLMQHSGTHRTSGYGSGAYGGD